MNVRLSCIVLFCVCACSLHAIPWMELEDTGYEYKGHKGPIMWARGLTAPMVSNFPFGGAVVGNDTVIIWVIGATGSVCKLRPVKGQEPKPLAFLAVDGAPRKIKLQGRRGQSILPYVYVAGGVEKVIFKGYREVGKVGISNTAAATGVKIVNASKAPRGQALSSMWAVIATGPLAALKTKACGVGGGDQTHPGVLSIGPGSEDAKIKVKGPGLHHVLMCGGVVSGTFEDAYARCWASQQVVTSVVKMRDVKKVKASTYGPGVCALVAAKKYPEKKLNKFPVIDLIGMENLFTLSTGTE